MQLVPHPIALHDMLGAASRNGYESTTQAEEDIDLLVRNAEAYNLPESTVRACVRACVCIYDFCCYFFLIHCVLADTTLQRHTRRKCLN